MSKQSITHIQHRCLLEIVEGAYGSVTPATVAETAVHADRLIPDPAHQGDAMTAQTAQRRSVQADRRIAGALLRGAAGSRAMAGARAGLQADAARTVATEREASGDAAGAADAQARAERLDRVAVMLGGPA